MPNHLGVARDYLSYSPETGEFTWVKRPSLCVQVGSRAGSVDSRGYRQICLIGVRYYEHRLAWAMINGAFPPETIDHINGDKGDNRIVNLRLASIKENGRNRRVAHETKTGAKGVTFEGGKYRARVYADGTRVNVGSFKSLDDALLALRPAREMAHGRFSNHG